MEKLRRRNRRRKRKRGVKRNRKWEGGGGGRRGEREMNTHTPDMVTYYGASYFLSDFESYIHIIHRGHARGTYNY